MKLEMNRVYNMDCMEGMAQIPDKFFELAIVDPPYNIGIAEWDNIPDYIAWLSIVLGECARLLKDNGTLWLFHMDFRALAAIDAELSKNTQLRHKQLVIINKGLQSIAGRSGETLRSYPRATEYLQFYTFSDPTGAQQLSDEYAAVNPMAGYLRAELGKAAVSNKEIARLFPSKSGGFTGCVSNWLLGLNFPTRDQYDKMRAYLNRDGAKYLRREYEDLMWEYEDLRREYEDLRYTFNLQSGVTDVWDIDFYKDNKHGHPSQKPILLLKRIIQTATNKTGKVLDPFMGVGSTAIAAIDLNRDYMGFEIDADYYKAMQDRIYHFTRQEKLL